MVVTTSVSQLRSHISKYLNQVASGVRVVIRDDKRGITIAEINKVKEFDKTAYTKTLDKTVGVFTSENHPEWNTKQSVKNWLRKTRQASQRTF